jgi:thiol-disulfide isomerase/thioredoxin
VPADIPVPPILGFDATTLDGQAFRGASLAGRPVVLWFWAPWCATCAGQGPTVAEVAKQYGSRVAIVGVAGLGDTKAMHEFVRDTEVGGVTHLNDQAGSVWRRFKITEQSTFVMLDRTGKVLHSGFLDSVEFTNRVAALAA